MKKIKTFMIFILIVALSIMLLGCEGTAYQKSLFNKDKDIAKSSDSYSFLVRNGNTTKEESNIKFTSFSGDETLWAIDAKETGTVHIKFNSDIKSGQFKVVLITPDNEVISLFQEGKEQQIDVKLKKGKSRIKIVGSSAKGSIDISLKVDNNMKVEVIED